MRERPLTREAETRQLVAALALGLGLTACQDKLHEPTAKTDGDRFAGQPVGPAGSAAGTAEGGGTKAPAPDDRELALRVKAALKADPALKSLAVDVNAMGNSITLVGIVNSAAGRDRAAQIALNVQGVNSVENRLVVVSNS
jgi:hypothetical protein